MTSQKAMSLPTSPHEFRNPASGRSGLSDGMVRDETVSTWNKILDSPMFQNKPLLPYQEWNIDFSEITVGTRVGIGNYSFIDLYLIYSISNYKMLLAYFNRVVTS